MHLGCRGSPAHAVKQLLHAGVLCGNACRRDERQPQRSRPRSDRKSAIAGRCEHWPSDCIAALASLIHISCHVNAVSVNARSL